MVSLEEGSKNSSKNTVQVNSGVSVASICSKDSNVMKVIGEPVEKIPTPMTDEKTYEQVATINEGDSSSSDPNLVGKVGEKEKSLLLAKSQAVLAYTCFTLGQRLTIFAIVIFIGFLGPMSGNIYIPALPTLQIAFKVNATTINSTVSVFMGVFSVGPLFWGLFADFGGRKFLYVCSLVLVIIVNVLLAAIPANIGALYVLRVFQAFASSSVISLGTGTVADITPPKHRGKAIAYFMLGPNMGPILAPIVAGLILMKGDYWRWLFGFTCIMSGIALVCVLALLPETLRCIVGNGDPRWSTLGTKEDIETKVDQEIQSTNDKAKWSFFPDLGIQRPRCEEPIFQALYPKPPKPSLIMYWKMIKIVPLTLVSISTALLFANYYAFSVTFSHFLQIDYGFSMLGIGAAYVCPGVAMLIGSQTGGHLSDYLRSRWKKANQGKKFPIEARLILQTWGIFINTAGCIGYGWSIRKHFHIAIVLMFSAFNAFGLTWCSNTTNTYLSELMPRSVAGCIAVSSFFRNVAAAISSAIIIYLCNVMGIGWCFTGLGLCNIFCLAAILFLLKYGNRWRNPVV